MPLTDVAIGALLDSTGGGERDRGRDQARAAREQRGGGELEAERHRTCEALRSLLS